MNEDRIREQQLFRYLEQKETICPVCQVPYGDRTESDTCIRLKGACLECIEDYDAPSTLAKET